MKFKILLLVLFLSIAAADAVTFNSGNSQYQTFNGSFVGLMDYSHVFQTDANTWQIDFLGGTTKVHWVGGLFYETWHNTTTDEVISSGVWTELESFKTAGSQWQIEQPVLNTCSISGMTLRCEQVLSSGGLLNYTIENKGSYLKETYDVVKGAGTGARKIRINKTINTVAGQKITSSNTKKIVFPFWNNFTQFSLDDVSSDWNSTVSYSQSGNKLYISIWNDTVKQVGERSIVDPAWTTNGSTSPAWPNTTFANSSFDRDSMNISANSSINDYVSAWSFDGYHYNVTTPKTYDSNSTSGNDGTLTNMNVSGNETSGMNYTDCKYGSCLKFDGVNDYVSVPSSDSLNISKPNFTITGWINFNDKMKSRQTILTKGYAWGSSTNYFWGIHNNSFYFDIYNGSIRNSYTLSLSSYQNNTWYHVTTSYNGSYVNIYFNGIQVKSSNATYTDLVPNSNSLGFGSRVASPLDFFEGMIDDVRIYNRTLSQTEIQAVMNNTKASNASVMFNTTFASGMQGSSFSWNGTGNVTANSSSDNATWSNNGTPRTAYTNHSIVNKGQNQWLTFNISDPFAYINSTTINDESAIIQFTPPSPVNLASTQGNFWVNYTWVNGTGNVTDSYNVSIVNDSIQYWINGSSQNWTNSTLGANQWSNITVYAWNNSGTGSLNQTGIMANTSVYWNGITQYIFTPTDDTYTAAAAGTPPGSNNYGDSKAIKVGRGVSGNQFVGLSKFNNTIPYSQEVVNATLQTYVIGNGTNGFADSVQVFSMLNNSWDEMTVTNNSFSNNYENGTLLNTSVISSAGIVNFTVTEYLTTIVNSNQTNFSFEMRPTTYQTNNWTNFTSKENTTSGTFSKLIIYTQNRTVSQTSVSLYPSNDAFTDNQNVDTNYGSLNYLIVGENASKHHTTLIKFDTANLFATADHKEIVGAYLQLNITGGGTSGYPTNNIIIFNQNNDSWWQNNVTYTGFSDNFATGSIINSSIVSESGLHNFSVRSYVQGAYAYRDSSITFELRPETFVNNRYINISSNESLTDRPVLIITYQDESNATYNTTVSSILGVTSQISHEETVNGSITQVLNLTTNTTYRWYNISFRLGQDGVKYNGGINFGIPYIWGGEEEPTITTTGTSALTAEYSNNDKERFITLTVTKSSLIYNDFVNVSVPNLTIQKFTMTPRDFPWAETLDQRRLSVAIKKIGASSWDDYPINLSSRYVLNITSNRTSRLQVISPTTVIAGTPFNLLVVPFDVDFNIPTPPFTGTVNFTSTSIGSLPSNFTYGISNRSTKRFSIMLNTTGVQYINVSNSNGTFISNPINVVTAMPSVYPLWYDAHGHTCVSDGLVNCQDEYYDIARNYSGLDVSGSSDHDGNYAASLIVTTDEEWAMIGNYVERNTVDNEFIAIQCYEFTASDFGGHRNPCFLNTNESLKRNINYTPENTQTSGMQADYIANGTDMYITPHWYHSFNASTDMSMVYVREIASKFGYMETYAFNDLNAGYKVGFEGGGDSNTGAGRVAIADFSSQELYKRGLTAVYAPNFTRKGIFNAIKNRRTYVTTEERMLLNFSINGNMMGSIINASTVNISVSVVGTNNLTNISIIRNGTIIYNYTTTNRTAEFNYTDSSFSGSKWYVVKVNQNGNGVNAGSFDYAWTSPIWVTYELPTFIPPAPVNLTSAQGFPWINYTWQAGIGNKTDSFNVSLMNNSIQYWINGSSQNWTNSTLGANQWSNITIYAWNNSGSGKLSAPYTILETVESYNSSNQDAFYYLMNGFEYVGENFSVPVQTDFSGVGFYLKRVGNPTGTIQANLYNSKDGMPQVPILASSINQYDVSTISTDYSIVNFTFSPYTISTGNYSIEIRITGATGAPTNYIAVGTDTSSPTYPGTYFERLLSEWQVVSGKDTIFYAYRNNSIVSTQVGTSQVGTSQVDQSYIIWIN